MILPYQMPGKKSIAVETCTKICYNISTLNSSISTLTRRCIMDKHSYIAVFDSGVGGVSVLRELRALMPGERFYYFGDSANAPYGKRPRKRSGS